MPSHNPGLADTLEALLGEQLARFSILEGGLLHVLGNDTAPGSWRVNHTAFIVDIWIADRQACRIRPTRMRMRLLG